MADNLGTAAYKLVLDARDFQSSAVQSGKSMRDVQQIMRETTTPAEKLAAKYDAVTKAYEDGQLPLKNYERYLEKLNEEANKSVAAVDDSTDAVDKHATATGKAAASTDGLGGSIEKAVLGYLSFQAVLSKVGEALQWTREQTEKAMATFEGMSEARSRLAQIADPAAGRSLDVLEARADELAMRYGEERGKVAQALFSALSEGFEGSLESLVKYGDIVNLQSAAGVAGQVPGLFKGSGLKPDEAVSATLLAARQSRLSFEDIASAMPSIAQGAAMTGSTPTEAMGILSVMSSSFQSGSEAANKFKALATKMAIGGDEFAGKGIMGGVEALMGMDEETRREFLGESQELNVAYQTLVSNLPEVRKRIEEIDAELATMRAGGASTMERAYQEFFGTGTEQAGRRLALEEKRKQEIGREIEREKQLAQTGLETQAAIDKRIREMSGRGEASFGQFAVEQVTRETAELAAGSEYAPAIAEGAAEAAERYFGGTKSNLEFLARNAIEGIVPAFLIKRLLTDQAVTPPDTEDTKQTTDEQLKTMQEIADNTRALNEGLPVVRVQGAF